MTDVRATAWDVRAEVERALPEDKQTILDTIQELYGALVACRQQREELRGQWEDRHLRPGDGLMGG